MQIHGFSTLHQIAFKLEIIFLVSLQNAFNAQSFYHKKKENNYNKKLSSDKMPVGCNHSTFEKYLTSKMEK